MSTTNAIAFHYIDVAFAFRSRTELKRFVIALFKKEGRALDHINYIFCTDEYLLQLNQDYLKHDTYTDIITFELSPKGEPVLSDIFISIDRVKENASQLGFSFQRELHRVIFHGALHLCGYKDKTRSDSQTMRAMEDKYLAKYFVPRGTKR